MRELNVGAGRYRDSGPEGILANRVAIKSVVDAIVNRRAIDEKNLAVTLSRPDRVFPLRFDVIEVHCSGVINFVLKQGRFQCRLISRSRGGIENLLAELLARAGTRTGHD